MNPRFECAWSARCLQVDPTRRHPRDQAALQLHPLREGDEHWVGRTHADARGPGGPREYPLQVYSTSSGPSNVEALSAHSACFRVDLQVRRVAAERRRVIEEARIAHAMPSVCVPSRDAVRRMRARLQQPCASSCRLTLLLASACVPSRALVVAPRRARPQAYSHESVRQGI